jgi:hypothetical protein
VSRDGPRGAAVAAGGSGVRVLPGRRGGRVMLVAGSPGHQWPGQLLHGCVQCLTISRICSSFVLGLIPR